MIPVTQQRIEKGSGDCFSACIASILHLQLKEVPNFHFGGLGFWQNLQEWMEKRGMAYAEIAASRFLDDPCYIWIPLIQAHVILTVRSQKFEGGWHSIIGKFNFGGQLEIIHDPNPNNEPYRNEDIMRIGFIFIR